MMLRALVDLAQREKLVDDPGFESRPVDFEIRLDGDGRLVALVCLRDAHGRGSPLRVPRRAADDAPAVLVDSAAHVLGIAETRPDEEPDARAERGERYRAAFAELACSAAARSPDPALAAVIAFYAAFEANRDAALRARPLGEWTGNEVLAFSVEGFGFVHDRPAASPGRGRAGRPRRGTPIAPEAAIDYVASLHRLLERDEAGARGHRYGVRLGRDTAAVFWTTAPVHVLDFFADLWNGPRPEASEAFFAAPWNGQPAAELDDERFFAVILGANGGRVAVRDWFETRLGRLKRSVQRFADDLALAGDARPLSLRQLLAAIDPPGGARRPAELASRIFQTSLRGTPLPRELLRHVLVRLRAPPERERDAAELLHARAALIKATLHGIGRADPARDHLASIPVELDETITRAAYVLGRLFAALERTQKDARGGRGATMRDRFFASASMAPASVFPRLLSPLRRGRVTAGQPTISLALRLGERGFPSSLSLEDQGLFAVGYYHQRQALLADSQT
jgi:CRISPR-associated protein Csd1